MKNEKKSIVLNGATVVVKKLAECEVKVGVLRKLDLNSIEGAVTVCKIVTGKDDAFIDDLTNKQLNEIIKLSGLE